MLKCIWSWFCSLEATLDCIEVYHPIHCSSAGHFSFEWRQERWCGAIQVRFFYQMHGVSLRKFGFPWSQHNLCTDHLTFFFAVPWIKCPSSTFFVFAHVLTLLHVLVADEAFLSYLLSVLIHSFFISDSQFQELKPCNCHMKATMTAQKKLVNIFP